MVVYKSALTFCSVCRTKYSFRALSLSSSSVRNDINIAKSEHRDPIFPSLARLLVRCRSLSVETVNRLFRGGESAHIQSMISQYLLEHSRVNVFCLARLSHVTVHHSYFLCPICLVGYGRVIVCAFILFRSSYS